MARDLPNLLQLRECKYGEKSTPRQKTEMAKLLAGAGRLVEALDLYLLAEDAEGIASLRKRAVREGRLILLHNLERAGQRIAAAEWRTAAEAAMRQGRWREAYRAYGEAGDEAGMARVKEHLPDDYEPYAPKGK